MIFQALAQLANAVRPAKDAERPGSDGHRRGQPAARQPKRAPAEEARGSQPVRNVHGETIGTLIDTEA